MITFEKNISQQLPYNRENYIAYFNDQNDDLDRNVIWYGVSLQQADIKDQKLYQVSEQIVVNSVNRLENAFKEIVSEFDQVLPWIINHDDKDLPWFNTENSRLPHLRDIFKQNNIPSSFIGCLVFDKEDLVNLAHELITYPYDLLSKLSYKTLDVSHTKLPFIIKLTGHLTLDIVSTDKALVTKIVNDDTFDSFLKILYRSRE
ncbi:hypothetical protein QNI16_37025 [Cytophagaceae bacterium YF14B1]|uniref:Uncharacterized protein n=1 Tax=Xanthocytophaga flava TaxID=3048013 RepID=A0AAE3QZT1_9BACT|nr:hypothetical protein [Xanthocytophaga flavus]MDJ1486145.1 hypothetical protein [Xanthocytophaga flavus]